MKVQDWLNGLIDKGLVCDEYTKKVVDASSKAQLINVLLDANGISFLCEMDAKGYPLPYETILKEFPRFANGNYVAVYKNAKGNGYDSCFYCCYTDSTLVEVNTTQTLLLGCTLDVRIKENDFVRLYVDKNCSVKVHCPKSSKCILTYWRGAKVEVEDVSLCNVELIEEV